MRCLALITALLLAAAASAATSPESGNAPPPNWYRVQVLAFRYTGPGTAQGETWPAHVPMPALSGARYPGTANGAAYARTGTPAKAIAAARSRLAAAAGYAPVLEIGWRQPDTDADDAQPVSLAPLPASAPAAGSLAVARAAGARRTRPAGASGRAPVKLDGTATLAVANGKPHVALDLRLCEPPPPNLQIQAPVAATASATAGATAATAFSLLAPAASAPVATTAGPAAPGPPRQCFAMHQQRQVKPGRLEYFDHPAFGVLVLVTEVSPPAAAATAPRAVNGPG